MAHHNYLIGHNTTPDRNKPNPSRLTALTPQNQPESPLLRGNQVICPKGALCTRSDCPQLNWGSQHSSGQARQVPAYQGKAPPVRNCNGKGPPLCLPDTQALPPLREREVLGSSRLAIHSTGRKDRASARFFQAFAQGRMGDSLNEDERLCLPCSYCRPPG